MNNTELGFVFNKENCIQCMGCEVACKNWNQVDLGIKKRRVYNIWIGSFPKVKSETLSVSCQHCLNPKCVDICPTNAIVKDKVSGIVSVIEDKCIGCKKCLKACEYDVPQFNSSGKMIKCDMCIGVTENNTPPCIKSCPTNAIEIRELKTEEKKEIENSVLKAYKTIY